MPVDARGFSLLDPPDRIQALIRWTPVLFPGIQRPGRDVDHPPPFSADVKNE